MTRSNYILGLILFFAILSCGKDTVVGPHLPTVELQALRVEAIEVALKITLPDSLVPRTFAVKRDGAVIFSGQMTGTEATVVDTTVLPARSYFYQALRLSGGEAVDSSDVVAVTTLDTTSHNYTWELQTIGVFQSSLSDVWGSSATNVYAVGRVEVPDGETQSNIIHFDGNSWRTVTEAAFDTGFAYGEFGGIYGFSEDDIWVVGTNVLHWDGNTWKPLAFTLRRTGPGSAIVITLNEVLSGNQFTAVWGASAQDVFAVGVGGRGDCTLRWPAVDQDGQRHRY